MDLKRCKGIFIDIDGSEHAFGTMKYAHVSDLDDDNYHDEAFKKDLLNTEWFKSLNFDYSGNIKEWQKKLGIGIKFVKELEGSDYPEITHLSEVINMFNQ